MKFLHLDGDSVVSLRFVYQEVPTGSYEEAESASDKLNFDTVGEIQDALANLFENGEAPFDLQDQILDLDAIRAEGNYTQADMVRQLAAFQNSLNGALSANGEFPDIADFMRALQEFMDARAIDLGEFEKEASVLRTNVEQYAERIDVGADIRNEMAELAHSITAKKLTRDAERPLQHELDQPVVQVAAKAAELPATLSEAVASVEADIADRFGSSAFAGFDPDQFA